MTQLSPLDALGPAFRRTREVLAQPFRPGFFLKIALIAALTQPGFYSASITYPLQSVQFAVVSHMGRPTEFVDPPGLAAFGIAAILIGIVVAAAIWIVVAYLYCRLRFTLFDLVVRKGGKVGRAWSPYAKQAWRYFGLVILVTLAFLVAGSVLIGPALLNVVRVIKPLMAAGPNANPFQFMGAMLPLLLAIFAVGALWTVADALMQDFLLPPMALENAPFESVFARFFALLKANPGSLAIYVLLRFAVGIGITWILMLVFFLGFAAAGLAIFAIGLLLYHALWASVSGQVVCVTLAILVGLVGLAVYAVSMIGIYGISAVFQQSYAACFFGGRYTALAEILEPPPLEIGETLHPAPTAPPPPPGVMPPLSDAPPVW